MKSKICLLFLSAALLIGFSGTSFAQARCAPRTVIVERLASEKWQEKQFFLGMINPATGFELFVNKETHTWTAITTRADGLSCILAVGNGIKIFDDVISEDK